MVAQLNVRQKAMAVLIGLVAVVVGWPQSRAFADPPDILRNYRFITAKSNVQVTGGIAGIDWPLQIYGRFGLVTGYNYSTGGPTAHAPTLEPFAQFTDVRAILFDPRRASPLPLPGWDLDKTLDLSGLAGTFSVPTQLEFSGVEGQGQPIKVEATLSGRLLHLVGANNAGCCDFFNYTVDAWAHQLPWADFNSDDRVDAADLTIWRQHFGSSVAPGADGDANGDGVVAAEDYTIWRDQLGQSDVSGIGAAGVPEPGTMMLTGIAILMCAAAAKCRLHR